MRASLVLPVPPPAWCLSMLEQEHCSPTHAAWPLGTSWALPVLCSWRPGGRPAVLGGSSSGYPSPYWKSPCFTLAPARGCGRQAALQQGLS